MPFSADVPTESELRIAQAQLVGWLEGLFHGIQASLFAQQAAAAAQLEKMRDRSLPPGRRRAARRHVPLEVRRTRAHYAAVLTCNPIRVVWAREGKESG